MWRHSLALCFLSALILSGCGQFHASHDSQVTLQARLLPQANLTGYQFDAPLQDVRAAIKRAFGDEWFLAEARKNSLRTWGGGDAKAKYLLTLALQLPPGSIFFKGEADGLSKHILTKPENENDAYLFCTGSPFGESQVYFKDGHALIYFADFHIHLTVVEPRSTRVDIFTFDSSVVTGVDETWSPHGPSFISVSVDPTTVEQYEILLRIGRELGIDDMPPLVTPGRNASIKELTMARRR
jgi:hypothetical protein